MGDLISAHVTLSGEGKPKESSTHSSGAVQIFASQVQAKLDLDQEVVPLNLQTDDNLR